MGKNDCFRQYPQRVHASTAHSTSVYVRLPSHYAVHDRPLDVPAPGAVLLLNAGTIAVFAGEPDTTGDLAGSVTLSPAYQLQPDGALAVPTGQVFVRFAEGVAAETRREELARAGYEVVQLLAYAPQAAWVRARSGGIAEALTGIPALEALADVENVEPQMLMKSTQRSQ